MMLMPKFTAEDMDRAHEAWGANCGPGSIAAICGLTLGELRPLMGDFESKHYTNPTLMLEVLDRLAGYRGVRWQRCAKPTFPAWGLARIQWEGPWMAEGVPMRARYRHTHWVGVCARNPQNIGVFDVNAMANGTGWCSLADWRETIVPHILEHCVKRASGGWHITHAIEIERVGE